MRRRVAIVTLVALLLGITIVFLTHKDEGPTYNGQPLSHWVLLEVGAQGTNAQAVLKNLDPKDIPYLVRWIQYEPPAWRTPLWERLVKLHPRSIFEPVATWIGRREREDLARGALDTFLLLRTNASAAIPALVPLMNNAALAPDTSERATRALGVTGTKALPALVNTGRDLNNPAHLNAASEAFGIMCRNTVDPEFTNKLKDSWARPWFTDYSSR